MVSEPGIHSTNIKPEQLYVRYSSIHYTPNNGQESRLQTSKLKVAFLDQIKDQ